MRMPLFLSIIMTMSGCAIEDKPICMKNVNGYSGGGGYGGVGSYPGNSASPEQKIMFAASRPIYAFEPCDVDESMNTSHIIQELQ